MSKPEIPHPEVAIPKFLQKSEAASTSTTGTPPSPSSLPFPAMRVNTHPLRSVAEGTGTTTTLPAMFLLKDRDLDDCVECLYKAKDDSKDVLNSLAVPQTRSLTSRSRTRLFLSQSSQNWVHIFTCMPPNISNDCPKHSKVRLPLHQATPTLTNLACSHRTQPDRPTCNTVSAMSNNI